MPLESNARLGPYRIIAPLGAGGMGEVFKARDEKLDRDVALKVLPARLASDGDALARFEREAKAVAALSHPNILAIHDFGQADGRHFAVMELLDGQTLRQVIEAGPLPAKKAIEYCCQIAEGLAAAHARGIVHRDLKPDNLFVTRDGHVKILDFGLARQALGNDLGETRTALNVERGTEPGMVMGTTGYMAPEQVRAGVVDHRADIFAFGAVLYEMLAGRRAFARATAAETMTAVLREEVVPLSSVRDTVTPAIERLVEHCLEKRPEDRFQSARDLAFALRSLLGSSARERAASDAASGVTSWSRRWRAPLAGALALGATAIFLTGRYTAGRVAPAQAAAHVASFTQVTDQPGVETTPSLSPDGKSVVYAKTEGIGTSLYLLRVGGRIAMRLALDSAAHDLQPAFSPDGERIAFRSDRDGGGVFLMTASGESVTRLTDFGYFPSWSPDGTEIVVSPGTFSDPASITFEAAGLSVVHVKSGHTRALATPARAIQPSWSPHGARIAYWSIRGNTGQRDIWTIAADGSEAAGGGVPVTDDPALDWSPIWSPDGRYVYFSSMRGGTMNLWRVPVEERSGRVLGEPEPITTPTTWSGDLSFSRDGTRLAFASLDYRSTIFRVPFDGAHDAVAGAPEPITAGTRPIRDHALSPDGEWIAFTTAGVQEDLFVARTDGTQYRRLTDDAFRDRGPAWSPDGARVAFYSDRSGAYDLWTIRPDGSGLVQLTRRMGIPGFPVWSPDGQIIAFGFKTWHLINAAGPSMTLAPQEPAISPTEWFQPASWSTAGQIAGLVSNNSVATLGVYSLATKQFARVPGQMVPDAGWLWPVWLTDGHRLIVRRPDGVAVVNAETGAARLLIPVGGNMRGRSVDVSRGNRWITYTETATEGDIWMATFKN